MNGLADKGTREDRAVASLSQGRKRHGLGDVEVGDKQPGAKTKRQRPVYVDVSAPSIVPMTGSKTDFPGFAQGS